MIPGAHMRNGRLVIGGGADGEPLVVMDGVPLGIGGQPGTGNGRGPDTIPQQNIDGGAARLFPF